MGNHADGASLGDRLFGYLGLLAIGLVIVATHRLATDAGAGKRWSVRGGIARGTLALVARAGAWTDGWVGVG